jgi:hypothetical protein
MWLWYAFRISILHLMTFGLVSVWLGLDAVVCEELGIRTLQRQETLHSGTIGELIPLTGTVVARES